MTECLCRVLNILFDSKYCVASISQAC